MDNTIIFEGNLSKYKFYDDFKESLNYFNEVKNKTGLNYKINAGKCKEYYWIRISW